MKLAIRMDDITPGMDWEKFFRFKSFLDARGIKPLIGVVPNNEDTHLKIDPEKDDFWDYIKTLQDEGWVVAMHGFNHVYSTTKSGMFPLNNFSEFAGLPFEEQLELLAYGVDIFNENGIKTDIFMAPGHSYDQSTLKALKELGFTKVVDGFGLSPYLYLGMTFYPISFKRSLTLRGGNGYSSFVYHTNSMLKEDFESFEKLLNTDTLEIISYSEYLSAPVEVESSLNHFKEYLMAKTKNIIGKIRA